MFWTKVMIVTVKCDNPSCNWFAHNQKWKLWHNKSCPKCNYFPIINNKEYRMMMLCEILLLIENAIKYIFGIKKSSYDVLSLMSIRVDDKTKFNFK